MKDCKVMMRFRLNCFKFFLGLALVCGLTVLLLALLLHRAGFVCINATANKRQLSHLWCNVSGESDSYFSYLFMSQKSVRKKNL